MKPEGGAVFSVDSPRATRFRGSGKPTGNTNSSLCSDTMSMTGNAATSAASG